MCRPGRNSGHLAYLLLAAICLLGFACFPVLAEADSSGIQYEESVPTATGKSTIPSHSGPSANASTASSGTSAPSQSGSRSPGSGGSTSASGSPSRKSKSGTAHNRRRNSAGLAANSPTRGPGQPAGSSMQTSSTGGSSPLVPILIAIAALAAISIAAVTLRQRRHSPSSVASPKAS